MLLYLKEYWIQEKTVMSKIKWYNEAFILLERILLVSNQLVHLGPSRTQMMGNVEIITSTCL